MLYALHSLSVNWRHIRLIDLVSAKGKTKVIWLISFHSLIRQCFNILIRHCNPSRIRNIQNRTIKTTISQQYSSFVFPFAETKSVDVTSVDREPCCERVWENTTSVLSAGRKAWCYSPCAARYLVHPKLLFPVRVRTVYSGKNAILRARVRSLTTVKLLYLVRVACAHSK